MTITRLSRAALAAALLFAGAPGFADAAVTHAPAVEAGPLTVSDGFSRATRPGAPVAGGFVTIANHGPDADRLVAVASPAAGRMEVHEMAMADGVMTMRALDDGLPIPAGATVVLAPGGYHVMFMDLQAPLVEGESVAVTLTFEHAGPVTVPFAVLAPDAKGFGAGH